MKTFILCALTTVVAGLAAAQTSTPATNAAAPPAAEGGQTAAAPTEATPPPAPAVTSGTATNATQPPITSEYADNGLRINFHGAPLNLVLDYLSEAAGFIINKTTDVQGTVEVWSKQPVTKDEVPLLLEECRPADDEVVAPFGCELAEPGRADVTHLPFEDGLCRAERSPAFPQLDDARIA